MLIVFDVEGVLVDGEFLPELAKRVDRYQEVRDITLQGIRGEINWEHGLHRRIEAVKGARYEDCLQIANSLPLMQGAQQLISELKEMGFVTVGVSGGFSLLMQRVKAELGLDHVFSNELVFHRGELVGYGLLVDSNKTAILRTAFGDMLHPRAGGLIVAVVDGANDLDLFTLANLKIAFNAQERVKWAADIIIEQRNLLHLLAPIRQRLSIERS